jgi:hypothetical protein
VLLEKNCGANCNCSSIMQLILKKVDSFMEKCYVIDAWVFVKVEEGSNGAYYSVVDNNGITASRRQFFTSVSEMRDYVNSNGGCGNPRS